MLHGERADAYALRRERERNARLRREHNQPAEDEAGARRSDAYDALHLADRLPRAMRIQQQQRVVVQGYASQARVNSAALRFASIGGVPLDLDHLDYEQLHEMFPVPARGGVDAAEIEDCSNVFRL